MNWQKEMFSQKQLTSESFDNDKLLCEKLLCLLRVLFTRTNGGMTETTSRQTVLGFQNTPTLHSRAKTCSALSFDRINFFNTANLFLLSRKAFVMCYCFRAPIKTFFFELCQMTVKSWVLRTENSVNNRYLYYFMKNYCSFIGLEQSYFSLIWNTYMWKLQTFCG